MTLDALLARGVEDQVFPLARLEVFHEGRHALSLGNAGAGCVFDLASLTKVMSTTALVLDTALPLTARVRDFFPEAALDATVEDLLFHRSGLPAWKPYFAGSERPSVRALKEPPVQPAGAQAVYSDLGFLILGALLEQHSGMKLDELYAQRTQGAVGEMNRAPTSGFRRISNVRWLPVEFAPTGSTRPREPAPGQEGLWALPTIPTKPAEVDDDNAWAMDGVAGHAGLFATANEVARFGQLILDGRWAPPGGWRRDTTPGSTRALGFDMPSERDASCGPRFGRGGPKGAIGHLGFTGTSLWIDLDRKLVVSFLTNRVALGRANTRIREFRPLLHEAVLDTLKL